MHFRQNKNARKHQDGKTTNTKRTGQPLAQLALFVNIFKEIIQSSALSLINITGKETYLVKHLNFGRVELISFFDTRVSFEEGASSNSSAHPFDWDHFTVSCYECRVTLFPHKGCFDS